MSKASKARVISREFKLSAVRRMLAGENVSALSRELGVLRKDLYVWRQRFRAGGPEALRPPGRSRKTASAPPPDPPPDRGAASELAAARRRIAALESKILFTYGALLDQDLMGYRCKRPTMVGVGRADGFRFSINVNGVATILRKPNWVVHGLLWRISRTDEASLDDYEGVDQGFYVKCAIEVSVSGDRKRSAFAYIATESRIGRPRPGYLEPIISAARDLGFPLRYIEELMSWRRGVARRSEHLV
jgi:transposase-like protein/gamma-glutamylcyclotransferase (GGCT)/AIG2-like uncharacterized protein YtfP